MNKPTCETCPFWEITNDKMRLGECHIGRPLAHLDPEDSNGGSFTIWPSTCGEDWCGEHPQFQAWLAETNKPIGLAVMKKGDTFVLLCKARSESGAYCNLPHEHQGRHAFNSAPDKANTTET